VPTVAAETSPYDSVPYPSLAYPETHPDRLATIGILLGLEAPDVRHCRVLEIGCGDGSNLLPMAASLPDAEFVGIDLASRPIDRAKSLIERTGSKNVSVVALNLLNFDEDFGFFDYIIAHGFYSWVPKIVQDKLFQVCSNHLTKNGIAFVSYNTYPAGHIRQISRNLILYHTLKNNIPDEHKVRAGVEILKFMEESADERSLWKTILHEECGRISGRSPNAVSHDDLGTDYFSVYFHDFIEQARQYGLQFISEAKMADVLDDRIGAEVSEALDKMSNGDIAAYEQYLDFVLFQGFRRTLLCHEGIGLDRKNFSDKLKGLWVASPLRHSRESKDGIVEFSSEWRKGTLQTNDAATIAALLYLEKLWPRGETFPSLLEHASASLPSEVLDKAAEEFTKNILALAGKGAIELRSHPVAVADTISTRPVASSLARVQARGQSVVTTILHTQVDLKDEPTRRCLQLLDGTCDHRKIANKLVQEYPALRNSASTQLGETLRGFCRMGLLIA